MTNEAPERIWFFCPECGSKKAALESDTMRTCLNCGQDWHSDIDYTSVCQSNLYRMCRRIIRADHAQAELQAAVAAEREAIAYEICDMEEHDAEQNDWTDGAWLAQRISSAIRARGDTDALAARDARVRAEALREAAVICNRSYGGSIGDVHKAILIPDQHKETEE